MDQDGNAEDLAETGKSVITAAVITTAVITTAVITTAEELTEAVGLPTDRVRYKARPALHALDRLWVDHSPMVFVATSDVEGNLDVSPKGDPGRVAHVLDDRTIVIPERAGNRRADGFRNLLTNPHVGLIFLIPGRGDTLRVNGTATIVRDAPFFDDLVVRGHRPAIALVVTVDEVFHHCSKAFLRSALWDPDSWAPGSVPSRPQIAKLLERQDDDLAELEEYYGPDYAKGLYPRSAPTPPR